jgi:hypothetical protein
MAFPIQAVRQASPASCDDWRHSRFRSSFNMYAFVSGVFSARSLSGRPFSLFFYDRFSGFFRSRCLLPRMAV